MSNPNLLHDILKAAGANKKRTRVGRGEASKGKTSGTGHKGQKSRGGKPKRIGFEGGQTEIYRRFPQRGFSNALFKTEFHPVNVSMLNRFEDGATVDKEALKEAGLISNNRLDVKILGHGELTKKLTVKVAAYSRNAHKIIGEAGGEALTVDGGTYNFKEPKNARLGRKLDKRMADLGLAKDEPASTETATESPAPGDVTSAPESGTQAPVEPSDA
jgi:large subunit ribosomal protein L15